MNNFFDIGDAVVRGTVEELKHFLKSDDDLNARDGSRRIPLDYCIRLSTESTCACVRSNAALLHAPLESLPICKSCKTRLEKAKLLLERGTDPNNTDRFGWTIVHQCAWGGDLLLLRFCVQKGGKVGLKTKDGQLAVQLAATRNHMDVVHYLDRQSGDLKSLCRQSINEAMGKRRYRRINELPLPPTVKIFLNYYSPYPGFEAALIPPQPWSGEELHGRQISSELIQQFIFENASDEFLQEHKGIVGEPHNEGVSAADNASRGDLSELIEAFQSMYLWEAFRNVKFEEPPARKPRYSMTKVEKEEDSDGKKANEERPFLRRFYNNGKFICETYRSSM